MQSKMRYGLGVVGLITVLGFVYLGSISAPPLLDDEPQLALAANYTSIWQTWGLDSFFFFRPVKNLVFFILTRLAPGSPVIWHAFSILLLAVGVGITWRYMLRLLENPARAFMATALFWCAPTLVSSISWLSCVNILIMVIAAMGCLLTAELAARQPGTRRGRLTFTASLGLLFLAQLSYESAVVIPALLVLQDGFRDTKRWRMAEAYRRYALFTVVTLLYLVLRHLMGGQGQMVNAAIIPLPAWQLSLSAPLFLLHHLCLWFWPVGQQYVLATYDIGLPGTVPRIMLSTGVLLLVATTAVIARRRLPGVTFGLAWFGVAMLPLCNLIPLYNGPMADYYLALPSIGLSILVAELAGTAWRRIQRPGLRLALLSPGILWALVLLATTVHWVPAWKSEGVLLERSRQAMPESFRISVALAKVLAGTNRVDEALPLAREAITMAPDYIHGHYALYEANRLLGQPREALAALAQARRIAPTAAAPFVLAGYLQSTQLNDPREAEKEFLTALTLDWDHEYSPVAVFSLGRLYATDDRWADAVDVWRNALDHVPRNADCHSNLALGYLKLDDPARALQHAEQASALGSPIHPNLLRRIHQRLRLDLHQEIPNNRGRGEP